MTETDAAQNTRGCEPGTIILRNGAEEAESLVVATRLALRTLFEKNPIVAYEAVMVARDPLHTPCGNTGDVMKAAAFLQPDGRMHNSIRNIIFDYTFHR